MHVISVNLGRAAPLQVGARMLRSAIGKRSAAGPQPLGRLGFLDDEQVDLSVHGGLDKAVYAYPAEHMAFWREQRRERGIGDLDQALPHGFVGENLSLEGLLEAEVWIGDLLRFADAELRVTAPREPCHKFDATMGFAGAGRAMARSGRCGWYLAVQRDGRIGAGEGFELVPGARQMSVAQAFAARMRKHLS